MVRKEVHPGAPASRVLLLPRWFANAPCRAHATVVEPARRCGHCHKARLASRVPSASKKPFSTVFEGVPSGDVDHLMFNLFAIGYSQPEFASCRDVMWLAVKKIFRSVLVKRSAIIGKALGIAGPHARHAFFAPFRFNFFQLDR